MTSTANPQLNLQPLPLEGLRVLDATHIVAGPFCSMILGDMGAEVIKIERPDTGDQARRNEPFVEGPDGSQISARYLGVNRNKKSVSLDLRDPVGKRAFENMLRVSDVLLDNWGPGAMGRLGFRLRAIEPRSTLGWCTRAFPAMGTATDCAGPTPTGRPTTPASRAWAAGWSPRARRRAGPRWWETTWATRCRRYGPPWASCWRWSHGARPAAGSTWTCRCTTAWRPTPPAACRCSSAPGR